MNKFFRTGAGLRLKKVQKTLDVVGRFTATHTQPHTIFLSLTLSHTHTPTHPHTLTHTHTFTVVT